MAPKPPAGRTQETQAGDEEEFETVDNGAPMETVVKDMTAMTQTMTKAEETPMLSSMTQAVTNPMTTQDTPITAVGGTTSRHKSRDEQASPCPSTAPLQSQTPRIKPKTYRRHRRVVPEEEELLIAHLEPEAMDAGTTQVSEATALSNTIAVSDGAKTKSELKKLSQSHALKGIIVGIAAALLVLQFATTLGIVPPVSRLVATWRNEAATRKALFDSITLLKENAVLAARMKYFDSKEDAENATFPMEDGTYCPVLWSDETWSEWTSYKKDDDGNAFYEKYFTIWVTNPTKLRKDVIKGRRILCPVNVVRISQAEIVSTTESSTDFTDPSTIGFTESTTTAT
uniref:Ig-like domain-containing protein n=1 Tax=Panagrellus redivivus TaxID=6233 RepID=A0A7E4V062_PANRE